MELPIKTEESFVQSDQEVEHLLTHVVQEISPKLEERQIIQKFSPTQTQEFDEPVSAQKLEHQSQVTVLPLITKNVDFFGQDDTNKFQSEKENPLLGKTHKIVGTFASLKQIDDLPSSLQEESVEESGQLPDEDEFDDLNKKSINICDILDSGNFYQSEDEAADLDNKEFTGNLDDYLNIQIEPQVCLNEVTT